MNRSLEVLLYGMQFRKLLEMELETVREEYGLCKIDMQILFYLYSAKEHNTSRDIMALNLFTRGHISQSLGRLQRKRLVVMEHDVHDRRCVHNLLTPDADIVIEKVKHAYERVNSIVFRGITEEEKSVLLSVAQKINNNIKDVISL